MVRGDAPRVFFRLSLNSFVLFRTPPRVTTVHWSPSPHSKQLSPEILSPSQRVLIYVKRGRLFSFFFRTPLYLLYVDGSCQSPGSFAPRFSAIPPLEIRYIMISFPVGKSAGILLVIPEAPERRRLSFRISSPKMSGLTPFLRMFVGVTSLTPPPFCF